MFRSATLRSPAFAGRSEPSPRARWPAERWTASPCSYRAEVGSVGQRSGEPEDAQWAVVEEPGHRADLAAGEGEHDDPTGVRDRGLRIACVEAERGLAVGPGRHQAGGLPWPEPGLGQEPGDPLVALVLQRD